MNMDWTPPDFSQPMYGRNYSSIRGSSGQWTPTSGGSVSPQSIVDARYSASPSPWEPPSLWDPSYPLGEMPETKPNIEQLEQRLPAPPPPATPSSSRASPRRSSAALKRAAEYSTPSPKSCSHCHATSTPLWRREPGTLKPLCNACGLYLQQRNKLRPQELIDADLDDEEEDSARDAGGPECSHCHTRNTSVWRRSKSGAQLCNACGVYVRLRGRDRPLSLKRNKIKPRSKHANVSK